MEENINCKKHGETILRLQDQLHRRNLELDAIGYVWCSGGCDGGMFRYQDMFTDCPLTEEQVNMIERNTIRVRQWFENHKCREARKTGTRMDKCKECSIGDKFCFKEKS
jgi:hypothetical protein